MRILGSDIVDAPKSAVTHNRGLGLATLRIAPAPIGVAMVPGLRADWKF